MIHQYIADLAGYALQTGLMEEADFTWAVNSLCQALDLDTWEERTPPGAAFGGDPGGHPGLGGGPGPH